MSQNTTQNSTVVEEASLKAMKRQVVADAVTNACITIDGINGSVKIVGTLRDAYIAAEKGLNMSPGTLTDEWKTVCRFEFDKAIEAQKSGFKLVGGGKRYGQSSGVINQKLNLRYLREGEIPVTEFPKVIAQFKADIQKLEKSRLERLAINDKDGAAKVAGKQRQLENSIFIMQGQHDKFTKSTGPVTVEKVLTEIKKSDAPQEVPVN